MTSSQLEKANRFRALHQEPGFFVIANAWDAGSTRIPCAIGKTPQESTPHYPDETADLRQEKAEVAPDKSWGFEREADACGGILDGSCRLVRAVGSSQFGRAAWYNLVGNRTASGEFLDTVTATAAHRSLPLDSFAKVTNLDNGRSIVVKSTTADHTRADASSTSRHALPTRST